MPSSIDMQTVLVTTFSSCVGFAGTSKTQAQIAGVPSAVCSLPGVWEAWPSYMHRLLGQHVPLCSACSA
eukprot:scaffold9529_cov19-Tisochrysis_lutea.AAC.1